MDGQTIQFCFMTSEVTVSHITNACYSSCDTSTCNLVPNNMFFSQQPWVSSVELFEFWCLVVGCGLSFIPVRFIPVLSQTCSTKINTGWTFKVAVGQVRDWLIMLVCLGPIQSWQIMRQYSQSRVYFNIFKCCIVFFVFFFFHFLHIAALWHTNDMNMD